MCSCGPPHMANQKQDDQLEHSYSNYVMIRDVTPNTCRRRWMIGWRGERGSGISVLVARHDDDDDDLLFKKKIIEKKNAMECTYLWVIPCLPNICGCCRSEIIWFGWTYEKSQSWHNGYLLYIDPRPSRQSRDAPV